MQGGCWNAGRALVNTDELEQAMYMAGLRVLGIQAKLHRWAVDDPHRRFGDLFNLLADPAFLLVAWDRVRGNKGAKTAGVDGRTAASVQARGVEEFLGALRDCLKDRSFCPLPSRERLIPKPGTAKRRRLGDQHDPGPGGPGVLEAGAGADLRGGFPPVLLRVPPRPSGP
jgi:retron-type reverse transcriptase